MTLPRTLYRDRTGSCRTRMTLICLPSTLDGGTSHHHLFRHLVLVSSPHTVGAASALYVQIGQVAFVFVSEFETVYLS